MAQGAGTMTFPEWAIAQKRHRAFDTGAWRDKADDKLDYEACLSPQALEVLALYLFACRKSNADGTTRPMDNWQKGMPIADYMKSGMRHLFTAWKFHRKGSQHHAVRLLEAWAGVMFNAQGYIHELIKENPEALDAFVGWAQERSGPVRIDGESPKLSSNSGD